MECCCNVTGIAGKTLQAQPEVGRNTKLFQTRQETVKVRRLGEQCRRDVKIWGKLGTQTSALWLDNLMFVLWRASEIKSGLHVTKKTLFGFIRDMPASEMSGAFEDLGSGAHRKSGAAAVTAHQLLPSCLTFFHGMNPHNAFIQANHGAYTLSCVI
ncbi:hypothetical protein WJX77_008794 [Trebouxia sp. C0004]